MKINKSLIKYLFAIICVFGMVTISCTDEFDVQTGGEFGSADYTALQALIDEAETYLSTAVEGVNAGNHPPGSFADFQEILDVSAEVITKGMNQTITDRAEEVLQTEFDTFKANVVGPAIPWVHNETGTHFLLSDNAKELTGSAFTIEGKFYLPSYELNGVEAYFFSNMQTSDDRGFGIPYRGAGRIDIIVAHDDGGWTRTITDEGVLPTGKWFHVTFVTNGTNDHKLYLDGVQVLTNQGEYDITEAQWPLSIGTSLPFPDRAMNALVQDFRLWSKELSESEINQYLDGVDGSESGLEVYFPFDANLGDSFSDVVGNSTATIVGNVEWVEDVPVLALDYSALETTISDAKAFLEGGLTEGNNVGDFSIGTTEYLQSYIDSAEDLIAAGVDFQSEIDNELSSLQGAFTTASGNVVEMATASALEFDIYKEDMVGMLISPFALPTDETSFTFEVEIFVYELVNPDGNPANIFGDANVQFRYQTTSDVTNPNANEGKVEFYIDTESGWLAPQSEVRVLEPRQWVQLAGVYDAVNDESHLYIDGQLIATITGVPVPRANGWGNIWLGNRQGDHNRIYGKTREVRYWHKALSQGELHQTLTGTEDGLEFYFPLNVGAGTVFKDETGKYFAERRGVDWLE